MHPRHALILRGSRRKRRKESDERIAPRDLSRSPERQHPLETKRPKAEEAPAEHDISSVFTLTDSASSQHHLTAESAFELLHKRKCQSRSGRAHTQTHKGRVVASADNATEHLNTVYIK